MGKNGDLGTGAGQRMQSQPQSSIGDYAIIGDCRSAALISNRGSLDWLCWPCFDSPSFFAAILDPQKGGYWQICPTGEYVVTRRYLGDSNALETRFETSEGVATLTDFMPIASAEFKRAHLSPDHEVIRILKCVQGEVEIKVTLAARPNYGLQVPRFLQKGKLGLRADVGNGLLALHTELAFDLGEGCAEATVKLRSGRVIPFSLTFSGEAPSVLPIISQAEEILQRTVRWWEKWAAQCTYTGPYSAAVLRSILTLKLLEFPATGAFVAAPTTSLPEKTGGKLNWDYRYCWLRDASLTIQALWETGFKAEAHAFSEWMLHATRLTQPKLMVMYDLYGNLVKPEQTLDHLAGYCDSVPVHVGNSARKQIQLDTYGEVICGSARILKSTGKVDRETAKVLVEFGTYVCKHWREPDAGIWEPREEPAVHTHSRLLCWVALHELIQLHERGILVIPNVEGFEKTRAEIRADIETNSWNQEFQSYTSEPGQKTLDATLLLIAWHNFEDAGSARSKATYDRVREKLSAGDALLYRYRKEPEPEEGAFGICSFWGVEYLAMGGGQLDEAVRMFEKLLGYGNDLGLFGEEIDPETGAALGNFPQGYTHIGVVNAALAIEKRRKTDREATAQNVVKEQVS